MSKKLMMTTAIAAVLSFSHGAWAQDAGRIARILKSGYGTPPASSRTQVYVNHQVVMQEVLETVRRGAMEIRLSDGSLFTLGPKAKVLIDEFVYNPDTDAGTKTVTLVQGALRYVSGRMNRDGVTLKIRTLDSNDAENCLRRFKSNRDARLLMLAGLIAASRNQPG